MGTRTYEHPAATHGRGRHRITIVVAITLAMLAAVSTAAAGQAVPSGQAEARGGAPVSSAGFGDQLQFVGMEPCAVFDTRSASGGLAGRRDGGETFTVTVASDGALPGEQGGEVCAAPPADAVAVELNLVAPSPAASGNLLVSRSGVVAAGGVVNFSPGVTNASSVPVEVDGQGRIDVAVNANVVRATHVRGVVLGYYVDPAGPAGADGRLFVPSSACAVFDTRDVGGKFDGGETRTFDVAGSFDPQDQGGQACTPPPSGVSGVLVNLVAVGPERNGNLRAVATGGTAQGGVVNFAGGLGNNSNAVPVAVSGSGQVDVTANTTGTSSVHVRGVVLGYYVDDGHASAGSGLEFVPMTACALFDTRHGDGVFADRTDAGQTVTATVAADGTLPDGQGPGACTPPSASSEAVVLNLVAITPDDDGNLQLAAAGTTSDGGVVNFTPERGTNSNAVVTGVDANGDVDVTTNADIDDAVDVRGVALGWHGEPEAPSGTVSLEDTFTDTDLTPLHEHTPDVGGDWEETDFTTSDTAPSPVDPGDPESSTTDYFAALVFGNELITRSDNKRTPTYRNTADPGSDEYDISLTWEFGTKVFSQFHWLCWRMDPTGTSDASVDRYMLVGDNDASVWELFKIVGGTPTGRVLLDSRPESLEGTTHDVLVEVRTGSVTVHADGVEILSATDSAITQRGRVGVGTSNGVPNHSLDDLRVVSVG